jgi:hypothetical protein
VAIRLPRHLTFPSKSNRRFAVGGIIPGVVEYAVWELWLMIAFSNRCFPVGKQRLMN